MIRASNNKGSGIGIVFITPEGFIIEQSFTLSFPATNNETEYEAVIIGLKMTSTLGVIGLEVHCDSLLVVSQSKGVHYQGRANGGVPTAHPQPEIKIFPLGL